MADTLEIFGTEYTNVMGIKAEDNNGIEQTFIKGGGGSGSPTLQAKTYTVSTAGTNTITADSGYDGLSEVKVTVPQGEMHAGYTIGYRTVSGARKWSFQPYAAIDSGDSHGTEGYIADHTSTYGSEVTFNAIARNTTITPTTSSQTIGGADYMMEGAVTVAAMPTGTAGTPTATKGTVSNHSISVTPSVTNTTGYITGSTKTGTAVTVSASELVSGTYSVTSSGTKDVTNYASASVPSLTLPIAPAVSSSGTKKGTISTSLNTQYLNIGAGFNDSAQYYEVAPMILDSKTITENGTYLAYMENLDGYNSVTVNVSGGGGGSSVKTATATTTCIGNMTYILFTGLLGEPTSFAAIYTGTDAISPSTTPAISAVVYDGSDVHTSLITNTSNAQVSYNSSYGDFNYEAGSLTVQYIGGGNECFAAGTYELVYSYDGSSNAIGTSDVQVGSGATSITFTNIADEPIYWSCIFKSNFSTSSGYQRVIAVANDGTDTYGLEMDSGAHFSSSHWTSSYSNGSLTITSNGTNQGGYFHQPGYYQLTYAVDINEAYQNKTVTPTTSQQIVTADQGYEALGRVTVNAIPNTYVQPTSTIGATTYRASTSNQTINAGTYHSAAATIAAVSQTNLSADNIKSGTTITISNGQSNLWSVTGTYTGSGGGGSASIGSKTLTPSNRPTSIQFTSMSGSPKAFTLRCTASMSRSSNSSYYYVAHIRYNGTNTYGNCWRMSNGNWTNITSGYSFSYSGTTLTITSSGSTTTSPGCFYPGEYELIYIY